MNLHGIVSGCIGAVNPLIPATLHMSAGYTTGPDGSQAPAYADPVTAMIQVQALSAKELAQLDSLNIQGVLRAVYLNGDWQGLVRPEGRGGDLMTFNGQTWFVVQVLESWPDWSKVAVSLQMNPTT